ncbi:unnamed protein product [Musa banksii]
MATHSGNINGIRMTCVPCPGSINFLLHSCPRPQEKVDILSSLNAKGIIPNNQN